VWNRHSLLFVVVLAVTIPAQGDAATDGGVRLLGRSEQGRPIIVRTRGDRHAGERLLIVGCIHGNECAGTAIVSALARTPLPTDVALDLIPNLNPDGAAAGTREDAAGVDLNRNFPWDWRDQEGLFDSGPRPLSERESRIAYRLMLAYRPTVTIWFHQHASLVDQSGGSVATEKRFAERARLPLRRLPRYPGSVTGWQNHALPGTTAFVVELPPGPVSPTDARRYAAAALAAAA
jgi:protein MpaA